jgi:hypothetical protein
VKRRQLSTVTRKDDAMQKITPCLWFDTEGEEAATFYTSVFPNSPARSDFGGFPLRERPEL